MSEPVSALDGAGFSAVIEVADGGCPGMVTLRADLALPEVATALKAATGCALPARRGVSFGAGAARALWFSPDELLLLTAPGAAGEVVAALGAALAGRHHLVADVSDARALFILRGQGVGAVLAKGAPVDLAPGAIGPGEVRRTRLGQVAVAFWWEGPEEARLLCFRSVAGHVFTWLSTAAAEGSLPVLPARL